MADWCAPSPVAARPITIRTGSFVSCPKVTGSARRTNDIPVRLTESSGRACASAKPGVMTM